MSKYCFLCLSDEGVFLNITPYNYKSLCGEVESYLPIKIEGTRGKQNKVCYKCAYELKQCSDFVKRYKESLINLKQKSFGKQRCNLCLEPAKRGYIFKLNKDNDSLNNLWSTIEKLFDGNLPQIHKSPLICLTCRYSLDILLDLTCLCQEMSKLKEKLNHDIDYSAIPKVNTTVIKRKTTSTSFMRIKTYVINDSDSDSNISKNQSTAEMNKDSQSKLRLCDQCKNSIKHGKDMYRFHRTGLTVCESCRGSMDLNRHNKKKNEQDTTNTKLCTVFLKDVLTDTTLKKQKAYKIEKDSDGNKVYVITESESEVETEDKVNVSKGSEKIEEKSQMRSKLKTKSDSSDNEIKRKKKMKVDNQSKFDLSKLRELPLRSTTKRTLPRSNHHSDTDVLLKKSPQSSEKIGVKRRKTSISSVSDVDAEKKPNRKKLSAILEHFIPSKDNISDDISITEDSRREKYTIENERKRKTTSSSLSSTNESECSSTIRYSKRTKLSKSSVKKLKLSEKESLPNRVDANETNTDVNDKYICSKCCATYENKLIGATHELTHFKQLELKLHKINTLDKLEDELQADGSNEKQLIDELAEQQNEEITLTVHDDEDIEIAGTIDDTNKQPDKEMCPSFTENQEEDSLKMRIINKESTEETKVITDIIMEPIHEESTNTNEHEIKTSEKTVQSLLIPTSMENRSTCSDDIKNASIQNDSFKSDEVDNEQRKINEATERDKILENENIESTESEKIELNLKVIDEDVNKENENTDDVENDSIKLQQNNIEEIEHDITNKAEKDKIADNEDKVEENDKLELEKDKIETTDTIEGEQKEQNSDKNIIHDELENFNAVNVKLNNAIDTHETQSDNLSQEKQKIMEDNDNGNDRNETNINTVDNVTSEDSIENSVPMCNVKRTKDDGHSYEGENEQINESSTSHVEKESKCISNIKRLHSNLENTNSSEFIKNKETNATENSEQESTNTTTEMVENMFDLATDELDNHQNVIDQNKRYSEMKAETLEDISREIQKSADMPSLEPINSIEVDHKELVNHN